MGVLTPEQTRQLYNRLAWWCDRMWFGYKLLGVDQKRKELVSSLNLWPGDLVVDLCCGTGLNFSALAKAVGPSGTIIGVDISEQMLAQARNQWKSEMTASVKLDSGSVQDFKCLPELALLDLLLDSKWFLSTTLS